MSSTANTNAASNVDNNASQVSPILTCIQNAVNESLVDADEVLIKIAPKVGAFFGEIGKVLGEVAQVFNSDMAELNNVNATDEVQSVYAFDVVEGTGHSSDEKDAFDYDSEATDEDESFEVDAHPLYAFKGTDYDNADIESVYAYEKPNKTCPNNWHDYKGCGCGKPADYYDDDDDFDNETDGIESVYAFDMKADYVPKKREMDMLDALSMVQSTTKQSEEEFSIFFIMLLVCLVLTTLLFVTGNVREGYAFLGLVIVCIAFLYYNCVTHDRVSKCERRLCWAARGMRRNDSNLSADGQTDE